ncbi:hypothetical protein D3C71_1469860 [compost metagenome]
MPAGGSSDWVLSLISMPSGREARPPVASRNIASAFGFLPKIHSSSIRIQLAFLPPTVSLSAATTLSVAPIVRWVIVRTWSCTWKSSESSSSTLIMSRAGA